MRVLYSGDDADRCGAPRAHSASEEEEIRWAISGNICRCTGYMNIVKAIETAGEEMAKEGQPA